MFLKILSIGGPLWAYATIAVLVYGLFLQRHRFEWFAILPAAAGLLASASLLAPIHRLFFDEDIYINVASNLTHAPVNQVTVMGGPQGIQVSTYPKEPAGWPVLLSLAFLADGSNETVAFWFARLIFALTIAAVYQLARSLLPERKQAVMAAILFGAIPICFWYSVSAGTDMSAALMAVLGMWGLATGNGALAAAGFAFATQTRMELLLLVPLVWISPKISSKWKVVAAGLALFEIVHVAWVMSVAPVLERAEEVQSAFGLGHVAANLRDNLRYLINPFDFPIMVAVLAVVALAKQASSLRRTATPYTMLALWVLGLFAVYLIFYAGSFDTNARYGIQIVAPLTILAASFAQRFVWIAALLISLAVPATRTYGFTPYIQALNADHQLSIAFAAQVPADDLVVSGLQTIFIDDGRRAANAAFAETNEKILDDELQRRGKAWYHAGVRSNYANTDEWRADRWMKSKYELHLIDSHEVGGFTIAFYQVLLNRIDREAR